MQNCVIGLVGLAVLLAGVELPAQKEPSGSTEAEKKLCLGVRSVRSFDAFSDFYV